MTPALEKKKEAYAETVFQKLKTTEGLYHAAVFHKVACEAWSAALQALKDLAPEFSAMECDKEYLKRDENDRAWSERNGFMEGAIWAHDQLKAKLALAEQHAKDCQHEMRMQLAAIQRLEAEAKRYREALESFAAIEDRWLTYPSKFIECRDKARKALGQGGGE